MFGSWSEEGGYARNDSQILATQMQTFTNLVFWRILQEPTLQPRSSDYRTPEIDAAGQHGLACGGVQFGTGASLLAAILLH